MSFRFIRTLILLELMPLKILSTDKWFVSRWNSDGHNLLGALAELTTRQEILETVSKFHVCQAVYARVDVAGRDGRQVEDEKQRAEVLRAVNVGIELTVYVQELERSPS